MTSENSDWAKIWIESCEAMLPEAAPADFLDSEAIRKLGIKCGEGCLLHRLALVPHPSKVVFGDFVRVDAFTILSTGPKGSIHIGSYTHVSSHVLMIGTYGIIIHEHSAVAAGCKLFSVSDDFSGRSLIGPMVPEHTRDLKAGYIILSRYTTLGVNTVVMPKTIVSPGSMTHANSVVMGVTESYAILAGQPAKKIKDRDRSFSRHLESDGVQPRKRP